MNFHPASPIFRVEDLDASVAYYTDALGFSEDWRDPGIIASVSRGAANIMLCQGDQGHAGAWAWIGVGDAVALFEEFVARGARLRMRPTNFFWACEIQAEDIDGNVLRFGSDRVPDMPEGPWIDMHGREWARTQDGWRLEGD